MVNYKLYIGYFAIKFQAFVNNVFLLLVVEI